MDNLPLPTTLTLVAGSPYRLKVSGQGTDKQHVVLVSSSPWVEVEVLKADPKNREQNLRLNPSAKVTETKSATLTAYLASDPTKKDGKTSLTALSIEPRMELPEESDDPGALTRLLLAESISPGSKAFVATDSLQAMQWMRHVILNRLKFGPQYFGAAKEATSLIDVITAPNQFSGFEKYPKLGDDQANVIKDILEVANSSGRKNLLPYRQFIQDAIDVATKAKPGTDPCPTGLYGWRTKGRGSPGKYYQLYKGLAGQEFYTLTESFRKDPLQRTKAQ